MRTIRAIDLFCGAGGSSWGARLGGVSVVAGFDASEPAGRAFLKNFPEAKFVHGRLEDINPVNVKRDFGRIDLILASPECTNHSPAKGAGPRSERSRRTALQVIRFAAAIRPRWVVVENVVSMRKWSRYNDFVMQLQCLGYHVSEQLLNAVDFNVPQSRRRLFLLCDRERFPGRVRSRGARRRSAYRVVDMNGTYPLSPLRKPKRARATLRRADRAIKEVGPRKAFLLVYYSSDQAGGWQRLARSLRTITTLDRFALVKPTTNGHVMRMLQVPELKRAMRLPQVFCAGEGARRQHIHLIGNAVCPPVMRAVVRTLVRPHTL